MGLPTGDIYNWLNSHHSDGRSYSLLNSEPVTNSSTTTEVVTSSVNQNSPSNLPSPTVATNVEEFIEAFNSIGVRNGKNNENLTYELIQVRDVTEEGIQQEAIDPRFGKFYAFMENRTYICDRDGCGLRFSRLKEFLQHNKTHAGLEPRSSSSFYCPWCDYHSCKRETLTEHLKKWHNVDVPGAKANKSKRKK